MSPKLYPSLMLPHQKPVDTHPLSIRAVCPEQLVFYDKIYLLTGIGLTPSGAIGLTLII
jgi:hypothetical protein